MFAENKSKLILAALDALLKYDIDGERTLDTKATHDQKHTTREQMVKHSVVVALTDQFLALRRLVASKTGFEAFTTMPGFRDRLGKRVIAALKLNNTGVAQAAIDCMSALMQPMHEDYELSYEQSNKSSLLSSKPFLKVLVKLMDHHIRAGTGALVLNSLFDFVTYAVCDPYSDTTSNEHFDNLLEIIANTCGRSLFQLYQHSSLALVKAGGQIMKSMIEEVTVFDHWKARMGFKKAVAQPQDKQVVLRRRRKNVVALQNWKMLYYQSRQDHAQADLIWNHYTREELREKLETEFSSFSADQAASNGMEVAWNFVEFEVVYQSLSNEIKIGDHYLRLLLEESKMTKKAIANGTTDAESRDNSFMQRIHNPVVFFNDLYHRFLLPNSTNMRMKCLQAMTVVYAHCKKQIGIFNDTPHLITMLEKCADKIERDRLLLFVDVLLSHPENVKLFIDGGGIHTLVDFLTLAHLHTERAPMVWDNTTIEAGEGMIRESEKEWYCTPSGGPDAERKGPLAVEEMNQLYIDGVIDENTRCWAQGMDGWKRLNQITQLKWNLIHAGTPFMNETELARLCLSMLKRMSDFFPTRDSTGALIRPLSRVKRIMSDVSHLPHLISLFLTFEPIIVERCAALLTTIVVDNPIMPQLYATGCFLFCLMYTGSNILPIARLLYVTHNQQAVTRGDHGGNPIVENSILAPLLPAAMILYLDKYGPVKFSEIFLGDNDTPEVIWNRSMRRTLINRISLHLSEYSPRLKSNAQAPYQHCPIASIQYSELQSELFCGRYYLRNLCNMDKYKDWPIDNHVELLRDILHEWQREVGKKPPSLSKQDAMAILNLPRDMPYEEGKVRKAYFRMAAKYHPDKNPDPEAREIFDKTAEAYELLCAAHQGDVAMDGPDYRRIDLIIRSQTILFSRYGDILQPYKYSGYPQLLATMTLENEDPGLFANQHTLLPACCALAYHTVNTSPLNADELRRDGGFEVLSTTFSRVTSMVSSNSQSTDMPVGVCQDLILFYAASAEFDDCRTEIKKYKHVVNDVVRCLFCANCPHLVRASLQCIASFGTDATLQNLLLDAGVLFYLLALIFEYDVTLTANPHDTLTLDSDATKENNNETEVVEVADSDEVDVVKAEAQEQADEKTQNAALTGQAMINEHARLAVIALAHLGGYHEQKSPTKTPSTHPQDEATNHVLRKCLRALLTNDLCSKLADPDPTVLLRAANINENSPYLIWNNGTRGELVSYLEEQKEKMRSGEQDPSLGADFEFSQLKDHLRVGDIYVDIYNQTSDFPVRDPDFQAKALVEYICEPPVSSPEYDTPRKQASTIPTRTTKQAQEQTHTQGQASQDSSCGTDIEKPVDSLGGARTRPAGAKGSKSATAQNIFETEKLRKHTEQDTNSTPTPTDTVAAEPADSPLERGNTPNSNALSTELSNTTAQAEDPHVASKRNPAHLLQAISALSNLISHYQGVERHTIGHYPQLGTYLHVDESADDLKQQLAVVLAMLQVFEQVVANKDCVNDIAANNIIASLCLLIPVLETHTDDRPCLRLLEVLSVLASNAKIVTQLRDSGALLYILFLFTNSQSSAVRVAAATFFARLSKDKLNGPKMSLMLANFLPRIFMDAWKRQPETAITMFDGVHENPELVWTESVREKVKTVVREMRDDWYAVQKTNELAMWSLPPNFEVIYQELENELVCDGVYVRLFNMQPTWSLRHPRQYLVACVEKFINLCYSAENDGDNLEQLSASICNLLRGNTVMTDSLASLGVIIAQVVKEKLLAVLLDLLTLPTIGSSDKALLVQAIKTMLIDNTHGEHITSELDGHPVWAKYKDQRHDLFISNTPTAGYLTGGAGTMGYLTATANNAPRKVTPDTPPPVPETHEDD
ncbi:hypothetical protein SARC_05839 [Sphaeroforma arctica JP610]|uniref:J domain-containing protein n=1 Tax=Sphaeroforma arctica JP610 TaxID=667725 RepID=A0A0L0FZ68_9EUKA|nr:hypothetical protein SARC_05839 [Sphaeroforma arctica JP610]KNC81866.1 hypothetical protein SARC_05839 [Sphaeroforma arctica JP610]|eukprot:XP_014155768.1 hypothetical protein SARC_05839 [Sphaeroforma arctica JP610]